MSWNICMHASLPSLCDCTHHPTCRRQYTRIVPSRTDHVPNPEIVPMPLRLAPVVLSLLLLAAPLLAQNAHEDPITLTLEEAVQIALLNSYATQSARLDRDDATAQARISLGAVLPNVVATSGYTRNLKTANPFAGSSAGTLFSSFGYLGWLAYNEEARTDDDPATNTLTFTEYSDRVEQGMKDAGLSLIAEENPFAVANQFQNTISVSQTVFDASAFLNVSGFKYLARSLDSALDRQEQLTVDEVRRAFYQVLLFQQQSLVAAQSVERTRRTVEETARLVQQGVAPKAQRLSAEVQLANLETQLMQTQNLADSALDNLKLALGIPVMQRVRLSGSLEADISTPYLTVSEASAFDKARSMRPDLQQLEALRDIARVMLRASQGSRLPTLNAIASFSYIGAVPSNRTYGRASEDDPFVFTQETNRFFSQSYWQPAISVGFNLRWSLFEGMSRRGRIQQQKIQLDRAELDVLRTTQSIRVEVSAALRNLQAAQSQILSQEQNVASAELNYTYAKTRLAEGVGTPFEERDASAQLDQSRINYLQAVYDFLIAQSAFEAAAGIPLTGQSDFQLTSNLTL